MAPYWTPLLHHRRPVALPARHTLDAHMVTERTSPTDRAAVAVVVVAQAQGGEAAPAAVAAATAAFTPVTHA